MAQIRANWFPHLRGALAKLGLRDAVDGALSQVTRQILGAEEASGPRSSSRTATGRNSPPKLDREETTSLVQEPTWFDEGHAVSIYEAVARLRSMEVCRDLGRDAARMAMRSSWRDWMGALLGHIGGTPRMAFEQLPILWNATRRDAGSLRCLDSSTRHATTELRGFVFAGSQPWRSVWLGHHDALLRELRFTGAVTLEDVHEEMGIVRIRTTWTGPTTGGSGPP